MERWCVWVPADQRAAPSEETLRRLNIAIQSQDDEGTTFSLEAEGRPAALDQVGFLLLADRQLAERTWLVQPCEDG